MRRYTINITQKYPLRSSYSPYEVKVYDPDGIVKEIGYATTKRGARRLGLKLARKANSKSFTPKHIDSFEVKL